MPIKPENKARYPKNWKEIRARIMDRAKHRCEWCGVENYSVGTRGKRGDLKLIGLALNYADAMAIREQNSCTCCGECEHDRIIIIVLTIAHVHDHAPENCDDANLAALRQSCHLRHDIKHHAKSRENGKIQADISRGQMMLSEVQP